MKINFIKRLCGALAVLALCSCSGDLVLKSSQGDIVIRPLTDNSVRVMLYPDSSVELDELLYVNECKSPSRKVEKDENGVRLVLAGMSVYYDKATETLSYYDADGSLLLEEKAGSRSVSATTVQGEAAFAASQSFVSPDDEMLFGGGQFQDGYLNIKGLTRRLTQVNTQISIPFILSNKGYGLLWNNYGLTDFNPSENSVKLVEESELGPGEFFNATGGSGNQREFRMYRTYAAYFDIEEEGDYSLMSDIGQKQSRRQYLAVDDNVICDMTDAWFPPRTSTILHLEAGRHIVRILGVKDDKPSLNWKKVDASTTFSSPVAKGLDYTVFAGTADEIMHDYRSLTGHVPPMEDWMFGYIHCRERYDTQNSLLENARMFHEKGIPVDVIVQDWQWWGKYGWNAMVFDEEKYPDPAAMVDELHSLDMKLMLSVWSKIDHNSEVGKQMDENGYYIPDTDWIDFFNPAAAAFYWKNSSERLLAPYGIDAWWQDATEPENDDLEGRRINNGTMAGEFYRNVYPLLVTRTVYEGLKRDDARHNPVILTRSGFAGMQRYGAVTWSGDIGYSLESMRRQIIGGLGQMAAGLPWWTYDAGGFFRPWGQYDNPEYQEIMLRWIEASVFLPFMRVHGYMSETEPWHYSPDTERIFVDNINLRHKLLPYITKYGKAVSDEDYTLMRPLLFDFPEDTEALKQDTEFMFGPAILVNPVLETGVSTYRSYLPANEAGWVDFHTGERYSGGCYVETEVTLETIPVFVKAEMYDELMESCNLK